MLESILKRIDAWKKLGFKESSDGSRIIGHTPRDFPGAYLHHFFAPRTPKEWQSYGVAPPGPLQHFYSECNGLSLFGDALALYGIRTSYRRDESAQYQPYDLIEHHREHCRVWHPRSNNKTDRRFFFGSYSDGSGIYIEAESPEIYRVRRGETAPCNEWPELKGFLESEYDRIHKLFTHDGYLSDKKLNTTPEG
jgi:hypothetical protein